MVGPARRYIPFAWALLLLAATSARGDEGMWLFNDLPVEQLQERYGFTPSEEWIEHVRLASVRFNNGGSGSFVSPHGLVLTNHHVAADTIQKLSTADANLLQEGFYAATPEQERRAPDLELNQLVSIEDVTERVEAAVDPEMDPAQAFAARRAVVSGIEKESLDRTGLRSNVITLYGGGKYHLYRYKRYTDVRLVWAPEVAVAFFGGDADNFEYPRYCLDASLLRVYEDGKPARIENYFTFSTDPLEEGELIFVSGNPGRTDRNETVAALKFRRDLLLPFTMNVVRRREIVLQQYGLESAERERRARDDLFSIQNSRKALGGMLLGLQDPSLMEQKEQQERTLRERVAADDELRPLAEAWQRVAQAQQTRRKLMPEYYLLERAYAFNTDLFRTARTLVRMADEDQKPNTERLSEYAEQNRESLLQQLYSPAPIYEDLEEAKLASSLGLLAEVLGGDDERVRQVLDGQGPAERAAALIQGTRLVDVDARRQLAKASADNLRASDDAMVQLALLVDPAARKVRSQWEEQVEEIERQAYADITSARFRIYGTSVYPDATFTLRLAFGTIAGYHEGGVTIPPWTLLGGIFAHEAAHQGRKPWELPDRWHQRKEAIDPAVPLDFVSTADIIGGNSGSPVLDRQGRLVGVIFDGNIHSLTLNFLYTDQQARAVSVAGQAILEALESVYGADRLVEELRPQAR